MFLMSVAHFHLLAAPCFRKPTNSLSAFNPKAKLLTDYS